MLLLCEKTLHRPEDSYLVHLISSLEQNKRKKSTVALSSSDVTGARALAVANTRNRRASNVPPSARQETALKLGDLDFSDEEEEEEKQEKQEKQQKK